MAIFFTPTTEKLRVETPESRAAGAGRAAHSVKKNWETEEALQRGNRGRGEEEERERETVRETETDPISLSQPRLQRIAFNVSRSVRGGTFQGFYAA